MNECNKPLLNNTKEDFYGIWRSLSEEEYYFREERCFYYDPRIANCRFEELWNTEVIDNKSFIKFENSKIEIWSKDTNIFVIRVVNNQDIFFKEFKLLNH